MILTLGSNGELVARWQRVMLARFGSYAKGADGGPLKVDAYFGYDDQAVQKEYQRRTNQPQNGVVSKADLIRLGLTALMFTVEGHMSDMFVGPCAFVASALEGEGRVVWRPTGYNNTALPFDNKSGVDELVNRIDTKLFDDSTPFPVGTPWNLAGFSQGAMIVCEVMEKHVLPETGRLHYRLKDFRKGIAFGNPYRLINQCASWVPDPPQPNTQGIMDWHFDFLKYPELSGKWQEHARTRDWYAENRLDEAGLNMTAIAKIITQSSWTGGAASIVARIMDLFINPFDGLIDIVWAIVRTFQGIAHLDVHGTYDLNPVLDWFRV